MSQDTTRLGFFKDDYIKKNSFCNEAIPLPFMTI